MAIKDIIDAAEAVGECDETRQSTFRDEFEKYENGELEEFTGTREYIADEREALAELEAELDAEEENLDELIESTEFLTVDQAVRHRDQTVEKLEAHNEHLREFHDAMSDALDKIERNLTKLESAGTDAVEEDPDPEFERARDALDTHNEAVEDLGTNLTILNAYLR